MLNTNQEITRCFAYIINLTHIISSLLYIVIITAFVERNTARVFSDPTKSENKSVTIRRSYNSPRKYIAHPHNISWKLDMAFCSIGLCTSRHKFHAYQTWLFIALVCARTNMNFLAYQIRVSVLLIWARQNIIFLACHALLFVMLTFAYQKMVFLACQTQLWVQLTCVCPKIKFLHTWHGYPRCWPVHI